MKKHKYLIITIIWMGVIFIFSSQNSNESSSNNQFILKLLLDIGIDISKLIPLDIANFIIRKLAHFTEYAILGILLLKTYNVYLMRGVKVISILTGFLYACSDEFHQYFVPGRGPAFKDVLIDTGGVVFGVLILAILSHSKNSQ